MAIIQKLLDDNSGRERSTDPSEKQQFTEVLYEACQGMGWMALLLHPILPDATDAIWSSVGQTTTLEQQLIDEAPWSCVMSGTPIGKFEGLFPREVDPQNAAQPKAAIRATH
jgi:methionyl-tRNA synthetase